LMRYFQGLSKSVIGLKPVASGCFVKDGLLVNADALLLQEHATISLDYHSINPYAYELPVSPHIVGKDNPVKMEILVDGFNAIKGQAQIILVEGAGGWYSPLNENQDNSDLAAALRLPVILVVGIRLGCINHAKLTYQAIISSGNSCAGWIAACINPDELLIKDNIATLKRVLASPLFGVLPYVDKPDFDTLSKQLSFSGR
jgi:dethiobiotin synthetase